jgi:hypothetical protein
MDKIFDLIIRDVAELPNRTSPEDWPEAMIVTDEELRTILRERLDVDSVRLVGPSDNSQVALAAAIWVTASPHEWKWSQDDQVAMARYCVDASSRLALWDWLTEMGCTVQQNSDVNGPRWCVLDVDGEIVGGGATPIEAIEVAKHQPADESSI